MPKESIGRLKLLELPESESDPEESEDSLLEDEDEDEDEVDYSVDPTGRWFWLRLWLFRAFFVFFLRIFRSFRE